MEGPACRALLLYLQAGWLNPGGAMPENVLFCFCGFFSFCQNINVKGRDSLDAFSAVSRIPRRFRAIYMQLTDIKT